VRGLAYNIEDISFASATNSTTVTIRLAEPLLYHMDTGTPGLVRLKLYGGRVDPREFTVRGRRGLVQGVRAEQSERDAFVYLDVDPDTRRLHIDRRQDPDGIVLTLEKGELPDIPDPGLEGRETVRIFDESSAERRTMEIKKVCLDPGHGGKDDGKTGVSGLMEKDVNLELAFAVKQALESDLGLEVVLTREEDELLSLTRRTEIANEAGADLFVSIHCNSWFSERTGGFEAYFLAPARSESERTLARYENAAGGASAPGGPTGDIDFIIWDLVQNEFINESSALAEYIQKEMDDRLGIRSRGVKQANFTVLQGARMPAVLVETAFLSNPAEEQKLKDPDFHRRVADGMVQAIRRLQERYR
jgi:N-acetylmuramoyl-L-alanine amidase